MKQFIAIESSSGKVIYVTARDEEDAFLTVGAELYGMKRNKTDTGNVDIDLFEIKPSDKQTAVYIN